MTDSAGNQDLNFPESDDLSLRKWALPVQKQTLKAEEPKAACDKSESEELTGIEYLIPKPIYELCNDPKTLELRFFCDAQKTRCCYAITWDEDEETETKLQNFLQIFGKYQVEVMKTAKSISSIHIGESPTPVTAKCDGPCKKAFASNLLTTIGRCGHYLCTACFGIVKNEDGTNGCSSLNCFWKGSSRAETKKNYEKDVCRKQRARAKDMNLRGIDVKPASEASQDLSSTSSSVSSESSPSKTTRTLSILPSFTKTAKQTSSEEFIKVSMVLLEEEVEYGMVHAYMNSKLPTTTKLLKAIEVLLRLKRKKLADYLENCDMYYGVLTHHGKVGMRRIEKSKYDRITLEDIPKLKSSGDRLGLIMDMNKFVPSRVKVYLQ